MMSVTYRHFDPSPVLTPYVVRYSFARFEGNRGEESPLQRCLPTGMAELIFQVDENDAFGFIGNVWSKFPRVYLVGIMKEPVDWKLPHKAALFTIRFTPEGILRLFNLPLADFFNMFVDGELFLKKRYSAFIEKIQLATNIAERINIAETFLMTRLFEETKGIDYFEEALKLIRHCGGRVILHKLNKSLYVSNRQLERRFKNYLGITPKTYQRIIRFNDAVNYIQTKKEIDWLDISYNFGYSDQSHFIRDFRQFSGTTPTALMQEIYNSLPENT